MPVPSNWHPGEIAAQQARGFEDDVWGVWNNYEEGAPDWMELFLHQLPFLSVTTLDDKGRPWASLITNDGRPGFIEAVPTSSYKTNVLRFTIRAQVGVPIRETLARLHGELENGVAALDGSGEALSRFQMAAVGVMLHNRRRNKMEGVIVDIHQAPANDDDDKFVFDVLAHNTFGNCPKYINTRLVIPSGLAEGDRTKTQLLQGLRCVRGTSDLPVEVLKAVQSADLLFLATKYSGNDPSSYMPDPARLGNNHRGGPTGFLRTFIDEESGNQRCIVLPDWSGNRLMMSFGNMTKDPVAGVVIPVWSTQQGQSSGVLHLTCRAEVLATDEARKLMRGVQGAAKLWIEAWTWLPQGLPCFVAAAPGSDPVGFSPYNPPVRILKRESAIEAGEAAQGQDTARIVDARFYSEDIGTIAFEIDNGSHIFRNYKPGMHVVVDCYELMDTRLKMYSHMASHRGGEKDLNDDGVRSWTLTHASPVEGKQQCQKDTWRFEVTLRRKNRGSVTPGLFRIGAHIRQNLDASGGQSAGTGWRPPVPVLGIDGDAALPDAQTLRALYLVSGIGITPMLAHLSQLKQPSKITAIVATRRDEATIVLCMIIDALKRLPLQSQHLDVDLDVHLLVSATSHGQAAQDAEASTDEAREQELLASLPEKIAVTIKKSHGKRLAESSLLGNGASSDDVAYSLDAATAADLKDAALDMALICAAPAFARTAQAALQSANIVPRQLHMESFSF